MAVYVREGLHVVAVDLPSQLEAVGVEIHLPKKEEGLCFGCLSFSQW